MATKTFGQLTAAGTIDANTIVPVEQGGFAVRTTVGGIEDFLSSSRVDGAFGDVYSVPAGATGLVIDLPDGVSSQTNIVAAFGWSGVAGSHGLWLITRETSNINISNVFRSGSIASGNVRLEKNAGTTTVNAKHDNASAVSYRFKFVRF